MANNSQKVAIVTGSNKGIGFEIVRGLCKKFDGVVYLTARNAENGNKAIEQLEKEGLKAQFYQLDIENVENIKKFAEYLKEKHTGIDILVNNAAIYIMKEDGLSKEQEARDSVRVNFTAHLNVCEALFPLMKSNSRVVHISSTLGLLSWVTNKDLKKRLTDPNATIEDIANIINEYIESCKNGTFQKDGFPKDAYNMTKVAINAITPIQQRNLDKDTTRTGIVVSAVCPGYCKTSMTRGGGLLTAEQGAETPIYLSLLPENFEGPKGVFWSDLKPVDWQNGSLIMQSLGMLKKFVVSKFI